MPFPALVVAVILAMPSAVPVIAPPGREVLPDAVAMRDGTMRLGELVACAGGSCMLDPGKPILRADIAGIVFGGGEDASIDEPGETDRIVLREGGSRDTEVFGISPDEVVTSSGTFDRARVAAIVFAAPPRRDEDGGGGEGGGGGGGGERGTEPGRSGGLPALPPAPELPAPTVPPMPPMPPELANLLERGALWTGATRGRYWFQEGTTFIDRIFVAEGKVRERILNIRDAKGKVIAQNITLQPEELAFSESYEYRTPSVRCFGRGTTRTTGPVPAGTILTKRADVDLTPFTGYDLSRDKPLYILGHHPTPGARFAVQCVGPDGAWTTDEPFTSATMGTWPGQDVPSAILFDGRQLHLDAGRMQGRHEASDGYGAHSTLAWSWCREGAQCPAPQLPAAASPPPDPCARSGQEAGLRDVCKRELAAMVEALRGPAAEYNALLARAETNRRAFEAALQWCELYDRTKQLLEAILTGGAGPTAEAARSLMYLRDLLEKAQRGDLGSLFYPKFVKDFLKMYKEVKNLWFEITADDFAKMQRNLSGCSGKMPLETNIAAEKFLADLAAARQLWETKVAPGLNDLRTKALECAWREHRAWRECREAAICRGESPAGCGPEPSLDPDT